MSQSDRLVTLRIGSSGYWQIAEVENKKNSQFTVISHHLFLFKLFQCKADVCFQNYIR